MTVPGHSVRAAAGRGRRPAAEAVTNALAAVAVLALLAGLGLRFAGLTQASEATLVVAISSLLVPLSWSVVSSLRHGDVGVDTIALLAMSGALALGQYLAGAVIAVMLSGGNALEAFAARRARRELTALVSRAPKSATVRSGEVVRQVPIDQVTTGDTIVVRTGEVVPTDGRLSSPEAVLDEAAMTGEAIPVTRTLGEEVRSGTTNAGAAFELAATRPASESAYAALVRLVSDAEASRAPFARMADRYATWFLAVTLIAAGSAWLASGDPVRALAVLVVATPCPLILAAPVALVSGVSAAARRGVIVKGASAIEALGRVRCVVLDKTGTLTLGAPRVERVIPVDGLAADEILRLAASLDQLSAHTLAKSLVTAAHERSLVLEIPTDTAEGVGEGITGRVGSHRVLVGSAAFAAREGVDPAGLARAAGAAADGPQRARILVAVDGGAAGTVVMADRLRDDAVSLIADLHRIGVAHVAIASGDSVQVTERVGRELGVDAVYADLAPAAKLALCTRLRSGLGPVAMVGDGINDAPALAAADVGIALGTGGGTAAAETADVVIVDDRIGRVVEALRIGRRSMAIARQSVLAGIGLSMVGMAAAALGHLPPVAGALAQEGIDVAVILNALRALHIPVPAPEKTLTFSRQTGNQ
jgi:heavy metal translocating P-type ATPase